MKRKILNFILFIIFTILLFSLTGCTDNKNNNVNNNVDSSNGNSNSEVIEENGKIEMNSELDGVYAFARTNNSIVALKENGEEIKIIDDRDYQSEAYRYSDIEYSAGKLYLSDIDLSYTESKASANFPFTTSTATANGYMYYVIDLNKGNGNYTVEWLYDYYPENEKHCGVDIPKVYNNVLYFVKNGNEIVSLDVNTKELKTIRKFRNNMDVNGMNVASSASCLLDKKNEMLYYAGITDDNISKLYSYNINTLEEKVIEEGDLFRLNQITDKGLYYILEILESYELNYKLYDFSLKTVQMMPEELQYTNPLVCGDNMYYFEAIEDEMGMSNIVVRDKDGNKKTYFENSLYHTNDGYYYYGDDKVKLIVDDKIYIIDNNTLELTEIDKSYEDFTLVTEESNVNTNLNIQNYTINKQDLIGEWKIKGTESSITKYAVGTMYGSSLKLGNYIKFLENNTYSFGIGIAYAEEGNFEIKDNKIVLTNIINKNENPGFRERGNEEEYFYISEKDGKKVIIFKEYVDDEIIDVMFEKVEK